MAVSTIISSGVISDSLIEDSSS
eukprot:COSAG02_NODE_54536_length_295_cov_1.301020_2_plen_22_part_01